MSSHQQIAHHLRSTRRSNPGVLIFGTFPVPNIRNHSFNLYQIKSEATKIMTRLRRLQEEGKVEVYRNQLGQNALVHIDAPSSRQREMTCANFSVFTFYTEGALAWSEGADNIVMEAQRRDRSPEARAIAQSASNAVFQVKSKADEMLHDDAGRVRVQRSCSQTREKRPLSFKRGRVRARRKF